MSHTEMKRREEDITFIGRIDFRGNRGQFGIKRADRRYHLFILGKTGMGKSTLLQTMIHQDLVRGEGLCLVDPHGDLVQNILRSLPQARIPDLIHIDPASPGTTVNLNVLGQVEAERRHLVASGLISVFKKIWGDFWGPRTEHLLRYTLLALLEFPQSTLLHVPRLLADAHFRGKLVRALQDPHVREFWVQEFAGYPARLRAESIAPIQNKVGQFLASPLLRRVLGIPRPGLNMREAMDEGKVVLADLSKGKIGEDASSLLGSLLITQVQLAALSRADLAAPGRRDFYLYADEFASFVTESFADMLSEARKYGLAATLSSQHLAQIDEKTRASILGNVGTIISFRLGAEDARLLGRELDGEVNEQDFLALPRYRFYIRLMVDGTPAGPFSGITLPPAEP